MAMVGFVRAETEVLVEMHAAQHLERLVCMSG